MLIGYDGSKLNWQHKTGTENYASLLLEHLLRLDSDNAYRLYVRHPLDAKYLQANVQQKLIKQSRLWTQVGLAAEVWRHQPDILFIPAHTMPIIHKPGLKCVVTIHDLGYEYLPQHHQYPHKLYLNRTTEFAAKHASHLIAVSEFTKQDLVRKLGVSAERITVVYEGVDAQQNHRPTDDYIKDIKKKYRLNQPYILFVGTIQPRKNLVRLIEAFAQLKDKHPHLQLVLAGNRGWLSEDIYAAPQQLGVADRVKFLGYIDEGDKPALYAGAELTALLSLFEGFGLPILESMACGTPVIASDSSSLPEVTGDAGILVHPTDINAMATGLDKLLTNSRLRQELIAKGYQQIKKFSWQQTAEQTLKVFERVAV